MKRTKKTYRKKSNKTKRSCGGNKVIKHKNDILIRENFRNMFLNAYKKLVDAIKSGNNESIQLSINSFKNGFKSNQLGINSLIPITNDFKPIRKKDNSKLTPLIAFVPLLSVLFYAVDDLILRKTLIDSFVKNKGNINLENYSKTKKISALSTALHLNNKDLIKYLIERGADVKLLTDEQKDSLDKIMTEEEIEHIIEEPLPKKPVIKLEIPTELPSESGYDLNKEPNFWKPLFNEGELNSVKSILTNMIMTDLNIGFNQNIVNELWSVCQINKAIIPTYYIPNKNEYYYVNNWLIMDTDIDFSQYNIVLCATLLLYGIISYKMIGQDYELIFKGGKAIQLVLSTILNNEIYKSEDIDLLIMPKQDILYDELKVKNLSGHLSYLIKWFLTSPETNIRISVLPPNPTNTRANPYIYKLSYIKTRQRFDHRKKIMVDEYKQFSDIDFKEVPSNIKQYFEKSGDFQFDISELQEKILFRCPNIGSILDEKIYYYAKYIEFKNILKRREKITEIGYENLTELDIDRYLEKFKKAIVAMNKGLQKQRFPDILPFELNERERKSILTRLNKLGIINENTKNEILDTLYS